MMKLNNTYYILRHGQSLSNVKGLASSWPETFENPLTIQGREQIEAATAHLKDKGISLIFSSDVLRARQTAEIAGSILSIVPSHDARLREISFGQFNGMPIIRWRNYFASEQERITRAPLGAENYEQVSERMSGFLRDIDGKHAGKVILVVSHECPLSLLEWNVRGLSIAEGIERSPEVTGRIGNGEIRELNLI